MAATEHISDKFPKKFGKYHLLAPLAQGGMGALYMAVTGDQGLERMLVIKTVLPHLADSEYVARFRDEAKVVVKLSHGNLVPVFDAGQVGGELFLAMDYVEGKDLRAVWNRCAKKQVAFPIDVAVYIIKELCRGLAYAHAFDDLQLVHRDISPPNVLVSYTGEVKLTDFGLASSTLKLEKTAPGIIYGKVAYMSPEQARGDKLDGRSDLYAAAIILWELLTGRQLFPPGEEQPNDLLNRARNPQVISPSRRAPRVPPELDQILVKALAFDPADRYPTGEDFREALGGWLAQTSPSTDAARVERFLEELFGEDRREERALREELVAKTRERARKTLPPTDELRQLIEQFDSDPDPTNIQVRSPGSTGRRAEDQGTDPFDRRRTSDRRGGETPTRQSAVVPPARGDAVTLLTPASGTSGGTTGAATAVEARTFEDSVELVGQVLDGRYRIQELIGEGGMGRVFMAEHVEIGKRVAVKILHPVYSHMPDLVERFRREARAASRIGHPNIVDVTDSGTTADDSAYFVMEYLEGQELANVVDREGAIDVARALRIGTQICRALAAAHARGIIHRDLKPENVYLTLRHGTSDFVKVLDFGIAKTAEAEVARAKKLTTPGVAMGTPEYMAPEQAAGRPADERCDVYSVGAILYETLTGQPPYEGDNFMEILTKKATIDPVALRRLRAEIPVAVEELVMRAMSRNPDQRPPSMEAFEYELTKCLAGRGAAVAQIIGMAADENLVSSLNPGLSVRAVDGGLGADPPVAPPPKPQPSTNPPAPPAGFAHPSGDYDLLPDEPSESTVVVDPISMPPPRSSIGLFGWLLLGAVLITAVGVIFFVAMGERAGRSQAELAASRAALVPDGATGEQGAAALASAADPAEPGATEPGSDEPAAADPKAGDPDSADQATTRRRSPPKDDGIPRTRDQAQALLDEAESHVGKMEWEQAQLKYARVVKSKLFRVQGLLGLAGVAFQRKELDAAIRHAQRALDAGAGDEARVVLGDAYYKAGNYGRALEYYDEVLKRNPGNKGVQRSASEARRFLDQN